MSSTKTCIEAPSYEILTVWTWPSLMSKGMWAWAREKESSDWFSPLPLKSGG